MYKISCYGINGRKVVCSFVESLDEALKISSKNEHLYIKIEFYNPRVTGLLK